MIKTTISAEKKIVDVTDNDGNIYHNVYAKNGKDLIIESNGDHVSLSHSGVYMDGGEPINPNTSWFGKMFPKNTGANNCYIPEELLNRAGIKENFNVKIEGKNIVIWIGNI